MSSRDVSILKSYIENIDNLSPYEFEEMVAEMYRCKGWTQVEVTQPTDDKGRDVIGFDKKGRKIYVEVKKHKNRIGRPVIQKLHSIMVTKNVEKGIVVSTSDFTPQAIDYARKVNISLVNGRKFITTCKYLIGEGPRLTALCTDVDINKMVDQSEKTLNNSIFSHPLPPSNFISKREPLSFNYEKSIWVNFSLNQHFQNSTGSWQWTMSYHNTNMSINPNGMVSFHPQFINKNFTDINVMEERLNHSNIYYFKRKYGSYSLKLLKEITQKVTTTMKRYRGRNNQIYNITCQPSLHNIHINFIREYWQLHTGIDLNILDKNIFRIEFRDDEVVGIKSINPILNKGISNNVRMCQSCNDLIFKGYTKRKDRICNWCGKTLCDECVALKSGFLIKHYWCEECNEKLKSNDIPKKKNKIAYKTNKQQYKKWKHQKIWNILFK